MKESIRPENMDLMDVADTSKGMSLFPPMVPPVLPTSVPSSSPMTGSNTARSSPPLPVASSSLASNTPIPGTGASGLNVDGPVLRPVPNMPPVPVRANGPAGQLPPKSSGPSRKSEMASISQAWRAEQFKAEQVAGSRLSGQSSLSFAKGSAQAKDSGPLEDDDDRTPSLSERFAMKMPSWLASMLVHLSILLILAAIPLVNQITHPLVINFNSVGDDADQGFDLGIGQDAMVTELNMELPSALGATQAVSELMPMEEAANAVGPSMTGLSAKPSIELGLSGRSGALKGSLLAAFGGNGGTERAVSDGLKWLARYQRGDGAWSLKGPYPNGGLSENKPAATAMALIAFAGSGQTHLDGEYAPKIKKAVDFLIKQQDDDGCLAPDTPDRQMMYAHAQATIALCEIYGMSRDESLRGPVQKAVDFVEMAQSSEGGWRYIPREDNDLSVTGWYVMALVSAKMAGLSTSPKTLARVNDYLDTVAHDGGSQYSYVNRQQPSLAMTAEGLLCREYLGWKRDNGRLAQGCERLAANPISSEVGERSFYYWYYATQTLHHYGGDPWKRWNEVMRVELPKLQVQDGNDRGSWPPKHDAHGSAGGRLYTTCFAIYCLEVYYRHLPIYSSGGAAK